MRIFSKTHDYYDSAMMGQVGDPNIIYIRSEGKPGDEIMYPVKLIQEINNLCNNVDKWGWERSYVDLNFNKNSWRNRGLRFNTVSILFAGKLYQPLILEVGYSSHTDIYVSEDVVYIYSLDQLVKFLSTTKRLPPSVSQQALSSLKSDPKQFETHFNTKHNVSINDEHFLFLNTPIAKIDIKGLRYAKNEMEKIEVIKDVNLGQFQFHRQMNAFEAYQALENYVSTVFGMQVPKIIEVSNREKIVKAGFDLKTSFRKEKES